MGRQVEGVFLAYDEGRAEEAKEEKGGLGYKTLIKPNGEVVRFTHSTTSRDACVVGKRAFGDFILSTDEPFRDFPKDAFWDRVERLPAPQQEAVRRVFLEWCCPTRDKPRPKLYMLAALPQGTVCWLEDQRRAREEAAALLAGPLPPDGAKGPYVSSSSHPLQRACALG